METFKISKVETITTTFEVTSDCLENAFDKVHDGQAESSNTQRLSYLTLYDDHERKLHQAELSRRKRKADMQLEASIAVSNRDRGAYADIVRASKGERGRSWEQKGDQ